VLGKQKLRDQHWDFSSGSEAGFLIYGLGIGAARSRVRVGCMIPWGVFWMIPVPSHPNLKMVVSMWDLQNGWFFSLENPI